MLCWMNTGWIGGWVDVWVMDVGGWMNDMDDGRMGKCLDSWLGG